MTWAFTGDGSGVINRVTPQRSDLSRPTERDTRTPAERTADMYLADHNRVIARRKAAEDAEVERRRQREVSEKAEQKRKEAKAATLLMERLIDGELADLTGEERGQIWMTMVEQNRVDIEVATVLAMEVRARRTQAALAQKEKRLQELRTRHQYMMPVIDRFVRQHNLPDTLESYEQAIKVLELD